jgi:hypothetical protein
MACIRTQLYIEAYKIMKFFSVYGGVAQDATRGTGEDVDPKTRDCRPHLPPDAALSGPGSGDVFFVDQSRVMAKEIACLTWSMVSDAAGQSTDVMALPKRASQGHRGGHLMPLHNL